jgi:hypothetical protein
MKAYVSDARLTNGIATVKVELCAHCSEAYAAALERRVVVDTANASESISRARKVAS